MAQQIALNIHYDAAISAGKHVDRAFVCHYSSHILIHEKDTCSHLLKMDPIIVSKKDNTVHQEPISYADIVNKFNPTSSTISNNPCAVIIECPHREIGGKCTPYEDLEKISEHCRQAGVALHMDGARLWEATAHYTTSTTSTGMSVTSKDLCNLFDSIYVSCYKGIGGMTGAVLLGKADFIAEARVWLRRFGGNLFTLLPYAVSSYSSYRNFVAWNMSSSLKEASPPDVATVSGAPLPVPYSMPARRARMQEVVALLSKAKELQPFVRFDPPVPEVSLVHVYIRGSVVTVREAHEASKQETGIACFNAVRPAPTIIGADAFNFPEECYFEFNMVIIQFLLLYILYLC